MSVQFLCQCIPYRDQDGKSYFTEGAYLFACLFLFSLSSLSFMVAPFFPPNSPESERAREKEGEREGERDGENERGGGLFEGEIEHGQCAM